jgi:antitoxin ParD1/3/4
MATMNVSLPDEMKSWAEAQAQHGRYSNVSDYVRDLIRRDKERTAVIAELRALIDDGIASGVSDLSMDEIFEEAMRQVGQTQLPNG